MQKTVYTESEGSRPPFSIRLGRMPDKYPKAHGITVPMHSVMSDKIAYPRCTRAILYDITIAQYRSTPKTKVTTSIFDTFISNAG